MDLLQFYGLREDPFRLTPDPMFFFPSVVHNEALLSMNYVVQQREGFCLITGEPGTGKTTLLNVFKEHWKDKAEIALVLTPRLSPEDFLLSLLDDLNVKLMRTNKNDILKAFREFLIERSAIGKPVIIIVDEAQNLPDETLEELRLLSNLETEKDKLLQIILIGQPELELRLNNDNLRQLSQRITVKIRLSPLSSNETFEYINYRLIKAGKGFLKLDDHLLKPIHKLSNGIPRVINILSSRAIMSAYLEGSNIITEKHVRYAMKHLKNETVNSPPMTSYAIALIALLTIGAASGYYYYNFLHNQPQLAPRPANELKTETANSDPQQQALNQQPAAVEHKPEQSSAAKDPIRVEEKKKIPKTLMVSVNSATLRTNPSLDASPLTWAAKGVVLEVLDELSEDTGKKWYKVKISDGSEGWIADKVVALTK